MRKYILIYFGFFMAASFFSACGNNDGQKVTKEETGKTGKVPIDASIFKTDKGWGYSILIDNKLFIRQDIVPAVEGNQGFATKEDATKVAKFVLQKIDNKEKPIVTKEDLKQLGIIQ
jgi:hypothetical protein